MSPNTTIHRFQGLYLYPQLHVETTTSPRLHSRKIKEIKFTHSQATPQWRPKLPHILQWDTVTPHLPTYFIPHSTITTFASWIIRVHRHVFGEEIDEIQVIRTLALLFASVVSGVISDYNLIEYQILDWSCFLVIGGELNNIGYVLDYFFSSVVLAWKREAEISIQSFITIGGCTFGRCGW